MPTAGPESGFFAPGMLCFRLELGSTGCCPLHTEYIDTAGALEEFVGRVRGADWIALDTEFIRETTYYPRLCLIQAATNEHLACIDPLALDSLAPLETLLFDPETVKVFHAAHQDLEIFLHRFGRVPAPVFDTQVAASLAGIGDQVGYGALIQQVLDVQLEKSHSREDWERRPIPGRALEYAADDVRYLGKAYLRLRERLERRDRLDWLRDDFQRMTSPDQYIVEPNEAWRRVKGSKKLRPPQMGVLAALAEWREHQALEQNRPRRWILKDEILVDLARRRPSDRQQLQGMRGLPPGVRERHGDKLLEVIRDAADRSIDMPPPPPRLTPEQDALLDCLMGLVRLVGAREDISPASLTTRKELERLVRGERDLRVLSGWRRRVLGEKLVSFLSAESALLVDNGELSLVERTT